MQSFCECILFKDRVHKSHQAVGCKMPYKMKKHAVSWQSDPMAWFLSLISIKRLGEVYLFCKNNQKKQLSSHYLLWSWQRLGDLTQGVLKASKSETPRFLRVGTLTGSYLLLIPENCATVCQEVP